MDGHFQGPKICFLGRFVFVVMLRAFLFIFTPQAQKVRGSISRGLNANSFTSDPISISITTQQVGQTER